MRVNEQAIVASLPTQFQMQDQKMRDLELRLEKLEKMVEAINQRQAKPVDGRTLRWMK